VTMRHFRTLLAHELRAAALAGGTWVSAALFLALMGAVHWFAVLDGAEAPQTATPLEATFQLFWIPLLCVLPLLTMRSFAEERRQGTLAALLTTPASPAAVVWAKFTAVWLTWLAFWLAFAAFPALVAQRLATAGDFRLGDPIVLGGGLAFIAVSGLLHVALGILCSCLTRSSALAALLTFVGLLAFTAAGGALEKLPIESWDWLGWLREPAAHLRTFSHMEDFTRGILDARPFVLYASGMLLCLGLAVLTVEGQE
jgi:ABC-2 type transport system permease protein